MRPFADDMEVLAGSRVIKASFERTPVQDAQEWVAADLGFDMSRTFVVGLIGFTTTESVYQFDPETFSWISGRQQGPQAASDRSMVPFAVDLRNDRRWIAFGTAQRIRPQGFANAFQVALNNAVQELRLLPSIWEVDLVTSPTTIVEWLAENPDVINVRRTVRYPNPVRDLRGVHAEMAELAAKVKREEFSAPAGQRLALRPGPLLDSLLEGVDNGNTDVRFEARGEGGTRPRFNTRLASDEEWVDDWGDDYALGMQNVLQALESYSARRAGEVDEPEGQDADSVDRNLDFFDDGSS
jgi:hypothetical protein